MILRTARSSTAMRLRPQKTRFGGLVHISGVVDPKVSADEMRDPHRVLVDGQDRLGNVRQIAALQSAGYDGPISYECFSPDVQTLADPYTEIKYSFDFIASRVQAEAA